ncbi:MAG: hypothetical protein AABX73_02365, partial [Nanoarchaeota archaeon]
MKKHLNNLKTSSLKGDINNKKGLMHKLFAFLITLSVITILVLAGPAHAFSLNLTTLDGQTEVEYGKKITFIATVDLTEQDKNLPIEEITVLLSGKGDSASCTFDATGKKIKDIRDNSDNETSEEDDSENENGHGESKNCHGFNIKKIPKPKLNSSYGYGYGYSEKNYGYGYGYQNFGYGYGVSGPKVLEYEVTFHTQGYDLGEYDSSLDVKIGNKVFSTDGIKIKIIEKKNGTGKPPKEDDSEEENEHENEEHENDGSGGGNGSGNSGEDENDEHEENENEENENEENENDDNNGSNDENDETESNKQKIEICHIPQGNSLNAKTIEIENSSLNDHLSHGDYEGECEEQDNNSGNEQETENNNSSDEEENSNNNGQGNRDENAKSDDSEETSNRGNDKKESNVNDKKESNVNDKKESNVND